MAIQISGTTVIDNSKNITNAVGGTFSGTVSTIAGTIGTNSTGNRTIQSGGSASGGSSGDIYYIY
jgi:hypothetical protein